jgi:hypothetical protein
MIVFIPHKNVINIYLNEIINYSKYTYVFGNFQTYKESYQIVNIQFPEAIFNWKIPTDDDLNLLEKSLIKWKVNSKIVYTLNDIKGHYDVNNKFDKLFKLIHLHADAVIHLGEFSLNNFKNLFNKICIHEVIYHPLYSSLVENYEFKDFNSLYNVDFENNFVMLVIGDIRSVEEIKLILNVFNKIPTNKKYLIVPRMYYSISFPTFLPYRFRKVYKKIYINYFNSKLPKNNFLFIDKFLEYEYLVDLIKKSSMLFIPRIRSLNSGNLFLGITFDKFIIAPKIGNITEIAQKFEIPLIDLQSKNIDSVVKEEYLKYKIHHFNSKYNQHQKEYFHPKNISSKTDQFYDSLFNILK